MGEVPLTILYLYVMWLFAHWQYNGFLPVENMREHREASTDMTVLASRCHTVTAIAGFVISNKGITPLWNGLPSVKQSVKLLTSLKATCMAVLIYPKRRLLSLWNVQRWGVTSSPLCFPSWVFLDAWSGKGGVGVRSVAVTACLLQCHGLTEDILWCGKCLQSKCLCSSPLQQGAWFALED